MFFLLFFFLFSKVITKHPYVVLYGSHKAKHVLINYFDIGCEHCLDFYRKIFPTIKKDFCNKGKLLFIYKPYPINQGTLAYMSCCQVLKDSAKNKALFETLMESDKPITLGIISECMEVLETPFPGITSQVLQDSLTLTQKQKFDGLPVMFFDKKRVSDDDQDNILKFLVRKIKG